MKQLYRYIMGVVLLSIGTVTLILLGLEIFLWFVGEMGDIGHNHYGILQAFEFVLLQMPSQLYQLFPIAALVGSLVGLGLMASHSELVVMRAAGVSITQIAGAVLFMALLLTLVVSALGEWVAPKAVRLAEARKAHYLSGRQVTQSQHGIWLREANSFIHIDSVYSGGRLVGITEYSQDASGSISKVRYAKEGFYKEAGQWQMQQVAKSVISENQVSRELLPYELWSLQFSPFLLEMMSIEPEEMTFSELYRALYVFDETFPQKWRYEWSFWKRVFQPFAILVMMLLALPFAFGSLRSATMGLRLLVGISVGFSFYFLNQLLGPLSAVYHLSPALVAFMPSLLFLGIALWLLRKVA